MKPSQVVKVFTNKFPFIGPLFWIVSVQYYITQIIVARSWITPYSWRFNTISDLGNTACGQYDNRFVCSPRHALMNASFLTLGLLMVAGAILIYQEFKKTSASQLGFTAMAIAGIGTLLVGLFPENTVSSLHLLGAALAFLIGNIGMLGLGIILDIPQKLRIYSIISGMIGLVGLLLFGSHIYLGLGIGGMERIAAYPQTMWLIVFGIYMSNNRLQKIRAKSR